MLVLTPGKRKTVAMPQSPTARSRYMGSVLKQLRDDQDLTLGQVAQSIDGLNPTGLSRIESGQVIPTKSMITTLCQLYGAGAGQTALMINLAGEAAQLGWWVNFKDVLRSSYVADEAIATKISTFQVALVPGILQTADYARSLMKATVGDDDLSGLERRVYARKSRRQIFGRPNPASLRAIVDESILYRRIGGAETLREQLKALTGDSEEYPLPSTVTVQVLPFDIDVHPGVNGPFSILSFETYPDTVYTETQGGALYLEGADRIRRANVEFSKLSELAYSPDRSVEVIREAIGRLA